MVFQSAFILYSVKFSGTYIIKISDILDAYKSIRQSKVVSVDNTYIANLDLNSFSPTVRVTDVSEDEENYYVKYSHVHDFWTFILIQSFFCVKINSINAKWINNIKNCR
jgi:hypothetical protein